MTVSVEKASAGRLGERTRVQFNAAVTDVNAVIDELILIRAAFNGLLAKLDADGGTTDTNYSVSFWQAAITAITTKQVTYG